MSAIGGGSNTSDDMSRRNVMDEYDRGNQDYERRRREFFERALGPGPSGRTTDAASERPSAGEPARPPIPPPPEANTSGTGWHAAVPPGLPRRNVAAFLITPVWSGPNKAWPGLLSVVPILLTYAFHVLPEAVLGPVSLAIAAWASARGNKWAWKFKRWRSVEHFARVQRRWAIASVVVVVVAAIGSVLTAEPSPRIEHTAWRSLDGHGVTFRYPAAWTRSAGAATITGLGSALSNARWHDAFLLDVHDLVVVAELELPFVVDASNVAAVSNLITASADPTVEVTEDATAASLGGLPATRFVASSTTPDGTHVRSVVVEGFAGTTSYLVKCQFTDALETAVRQACDAIVSSFAVQPRDDKLSPGWTRLGPSDRFSLAVPPQWTSRAVTEDKITAVLGRGSGRATMSLFAARRPRTGSLDAYVDGQIAALEGRAGARTVDRSETSLLGHRAILVHARRTAAGPDLTAYYVAIKFDVYVVALWTAPADRDFAGPTADAIARTLSAA